MQRPGWPDRLIAHRKWGGLVEFKGPETLISSIQRLVLKDLWTRRPGFAYLARFTGSFAAVTVYDGVMEPLYENVLVGELLDVLREWTETVRSDDRPSCTASEEAVLLGVIRRHADRRIGR